MKSLLGWIVVADVQGSYTEEGDFAWRESIAYADIADQAAVVGQACPRVESD
jgi:hypothetical protein